ncbi:MAG: hypothetical protein BWZ03_00720 [bacterium ADurb.BinA186]|nr:MAG: hypothetical protein BWZ03_00720 [bacterium ADurb.BinA186]
MTQKSIPNEKEGNNLMTKEEVKARYNLSKWHGIALLILMILVVIGLGLSIFAIVSFAQRSSWHGIGLGICSCLSFFLLGLYSIRGYKMRILASRFCCSLWRPAS